MKIILTYIDSEESAEKIAETLLTEKLVACVGILPGKSRYWWEGKITRSDEFNLIIKTTNSLADEAMKRISEIHSYDLPAIDMIDVEKTNPGIEEWLAEVTK